VIRKLGVERQVLDARWAKQDYLCKTKNLHAPAQGVARARLAPLHAPWSAPWAAEWARPDVVFANTSEEEGICRLRKLDGIYDDGGDI
jgi:hypothetical protein